MPLDRSIGQIDLKVKGCQVYLICCKFTKVPVIWQSIDPEQMLHSVAFGTGSALLRSGCLILFLSFWTIPSEDTFSCCWFSKQNPVSLLVNRYTTLDTTSGDKKDGTLSLM